MMSTTNAAVLRKRGSVWADLSERVPADADQDEIAAYYVRAILTVSVELSQPKLAENRIPVQSAS
jgi:HSP20 family molecular chaperone IbpA